MIFLPGLAVIFAGLLGRLGDVDKQVKSIVRELHVKSVAMRATQLHTLTHHGEGTRELVRKLHAAGVISFEVVTGHGPASLRLVVYDRDGRLKTYTEIPLGKGGLTRDDRDVLLANLRSDVAALDEAEPDAPAKEPEPAPAPSPSPSPSPSPALTRSPAPSPAPAPAPAPTPSPALARSPAPSPAPAPAPAPKPSPALALSSAPAPARALSPSPPPSRLPSMSPAPARGLSPMPPPSRLPSMSPPPARALSPMPPPSRLPSMSPPPARALSPMPSPSRLPSMSPAPAPAPAPALSPSPPSPSPPPSPTAAPARSPAPVAAPAPPPARSPAPVAAPAPPPARSPAPAPAPVAAPAPPPAPSPSPPPSREPAAEPAPRPTSQRELPPSPSREAPEEAVSADEIAALTAGNDEAGSNADDGLHLGVAVGIGVASRAFDPSPSTVAGYTSAPVASLVLAAHVAPTRRTTLAIGTERTLSLTTPMRDGTSAATTISRWEAAGTYAIFDGGFELGPRVGIGRRAFGVDSIDPTRSLDSDYNYLAIGVASAVHLGTHVTLRGSGLFEPVLFGTEPTEMTFGEATRWAIDLGAAVEVRPWTHVFARVAASYQRFTWSWTMAGARGAGGAVDAYPSGAFAIGADY